MPPRSPNPNTAPERHTRQRAAIRDAIAHAGVPVTPKEVLALASKQHETLGLATVYRTLKMMVDAGEVIPVEIPGEAPRYEVPKGHHHHFHCRSCGKVFELDGCCGHFSELTPKGFRLDGHELLLYGVCSGCAKGKESGTSNHPTTKRRTIPRT